MKVKRAEKVARCERAEKVRGKDEIQEMIATTAEKAMVQAP